MLLILWVGNCEDAVHHTRPICVQNILCVSIGTMGDFNAIAKGFANQLNKAFPNYAPLVKLRTRMKQCIRKDPECLQEAWTRFFRSDSDALSALQNGDIEGLIANEHVSSQLDIVKLWYGMSGASKDAARKHLEALRDAAGLAAGVDPKLAAAARAWSGVFSEILGKRVVVPALFLSKVERTVEMARHMINSMDEEELKQEDVDELLDGVDVGGMIRAAGGSSEDAAPDSNDLMHKVTDMLTKLKLWAAGEEGKDIDSEMVATFVADKLKDAKYRGVVNTLRSTLLNVRANFVQSALRKLAERIDVSDPRSLVESGQDLDLGIFEEEIQGIMSGVDSAKAQTLIASFSKLVQESGVAEALGMSDVSESLKTMAGGGSSSGGGNPMSRLLNSELTPGLISQLPSAIGADGSIDVGRAAALALRSRRVAKRPRITGKL